MSNNMLINKNKDAYIYYSPEYDTVNLFIYMKGTINQLK